MKTILFVLVLIVVSFFSTNIFAQYYDPNAINNLNNNMTGFLNMGATAYSAGQYGGASYMNAEGNRAVNQSMANINNQAAYGMYLDNRLKQTKTFFENRQLNRYYRDLEEWQKAERVQLKRYGIYDREAIERIYGINR